MSPRAGSAIARYCCAVVSVALAIWIRRLLDPALGVDYPFATVFLAVLLTACYGGWWPALTAVAVGALGADYFLLVPRGSFALAGTDEQIGLALFVVTGLGIAGLAGVWQAALRRAESAAESNRRQAALIDQTYDAVLVWDWNGPITFWNRGAERLYGFPRAAALGQVSHDLLRTTTAAGVAGVVAALERDGAWEGELHHICQDGRQIVVDSRMVLVREPARAYVLETNRDATHRVAAQRALHDANDQLETRVRKRTAKLAQTAELLRVSEERLDRLVQGVSGHAIFMLDPTGIILTWNNEAERMDGYTPGEIIGRHYSCLFTPDGVAKGKPAQELALATADGKVEVEGWRLRKNGQRFWANGTLAALYDDAGKVRGFAKVIRDLTAKRHNDELLRSLLDHTLDAIIGIDQRGTISMINRAGERLFRRTASEVIGQNVNILMPEPYHAEHDGYLESYMRTGDAKIIGSGREVRGLRKDGTTFPADLAVTEFEFDNQRYFVGIVRDISERQRLEAQLHQSQKMEAFGQLAGGVAHDFNNLLTVISGNSDMLSEVPALDDETRAMIEDIRNAGKRASGLTRQLLAFSRQQVLEPRILDLNAVVAETEKMLRRLIGEDVELTTVLRPSSAVKADAGQIEQIIVNLAVNARDAMPQGGKLTIETSNIELDETYAETHPEARPGRFVMLAISDTGCGMAPAVKARLFEPFFTTKGVGKGTGLGLAVVHGIVKQSGGIIDVYSEAGAGSTFKICLPAIDRLAASAVETDSGTAPGGPGTILLVEDEAGVRKLVARALQGFGYTVLTAPEGKSALRLMEDHRSKIDLLVTDVVMPEMSGRELAETVRARDPELRVLFLSGYTDDAVVRHGVLQADVDFLQKPFTMHSLARKVREVLDRV
jgi:PAS domain S-box-containing protein